MEIGVTTGDQSAFSAFFEGSKCLGVVVCAGGVRNSFVAGGQILLRQLRGAVRMPVAQIGVSSGYATSAYFYGGGKATDVRVFSDDMTDRRMFSLRRRLLLRHPFDVDYVHAVFRGGITGRPINAEKVIAHPTKLYGVLADSETGHGFSCLPATAEEVWQLASVATAVTGFARPTTFRGKVVTDGYASDMHLPVTELIRLHPEVTDVLVFASQHYEDAPRLAPWSEMLLYQAGFAKASRSTQEQIRTRHVRFMSEAQRVVVSHEVGGRRVCIVWLPRSYHPIFVTPTQSRELIRSGYLTMRALIEKYGRV